MTLKIKLKKVHDAALNSGDVNLVRQARTQPLQTAKNLIKKGFIKFSDEELINECKSLRAKGKWTKVQQENAITRLGSTPAARQQAITLIAKKADIKIEKI